MTVGFDSNAAGLTEVSTRGSLVAVGNVTKHASRNAVLPNLHGPLVCVGDFGRD